MGTVTYYHFRAVKGRNEKAPWAIAFNAGGWGRSLQTRGWTPNREVYTRILTAGEEILSAEMMRHFGGRYESVEKLLEDEGEILGRDSEEFDRLEIELGKYEGDRNMSTRTKTAEGITKVLPLKSAKKSKRNNETITTVPADKVAGNGNGKGKSVLPKANLDVYKIVPRASISFSKTNPRKTSVDLDEMAESIRSNGILEPLLVVRSPISDEHRNLLTTEREAEKAKLEAIALCKANGASEENTSAYARTLEKYSTAEGNLRRFETENKVVPAYELIAGERRLRSAAIAGLDEIPVIVKFVTENKILEIQIIENLQRREVHPIEESDGYAYLKTERGYTDEEIALRVGKHISYIAYRMKLRALNEKSREYFEQNKVTLSHALEIAKYPVNAQDEILSYAFNNFGYVTESLFPMTKFIEQIQKHFLLQLKQSPFSTKSAELRADGLACVDCPERTNAAPLLFSENFSDKDNCLNRECWKQKTAQHIQIQRRKIVETDLQIVEPKKAEKAVKSLPLISDNYYVNDDEIETIAKRHPFLKGSKFLSDRQWVKIEKNEEPCGNSSFGIFFNGNRIGQKEKICFAADCPKHLGKYSSGQKVPVGNASDNAETQREARMIRKEEIFDSRTAESTRRRVLRRAAKQFDAENTIYTHNEADFYQTALLARLWKLQVAYSEHTAKVILEVLELEPDTLNTSRWNDDHGQQVAKLAPAIRSQLLFLLLVADKGEIFEAYWAYKSQAEIQELAAGFNVDYKKIDAEERLGLSPVKQKDLFRDYLAQIEQGNSKAKPPRPWSSKWSPKD